MRLRSATTACLLTLLASLCGTISAAEPFCGYKEKATVSVKRTDGSSLSFRVGIADTTPLHRKGLMECPTLPNSRGLLFIFSDLQERSFWMHHTKMPLAIVYIGDDMKVVSVQRGEPDSERSLPSKRPARYVLEVNWSEGSGIKPGELVKISFD